VSNNNGDKSLQAAGTIELGGEITICRLGYGAMRLTGPGIWGPPKDRAEALAVLRRAVELGVDFIDTADSYGPDINEELIAEALSPYPDNLVIATKGGWVRTGPGIWGHNATPDHLQKAVDGSLRKLRMDCIDVYQLHIPDPMVSLEDSLGTLVELQSQGKIRHIGLSNVTKEHIERARKVCPIVSVQNRYSFADREWDYVVDYCEQNGITFIPWFPLAAGKAANLALKHVAEAHNATLLQVALAWLLQRSQIMLPIPGTSSVKHLEENLGAPDLRLSQQEFDELAQVEELTFTR
jgi:aryl-alcohol dehydrogenase-like predicted oxidoreductase